MAVFLHPLHKFVCCLSLHTLQQRNVLRIYCHCHRQRPAQPLAHCSRSRRGIDTGGESVWWIHAGALLLLLLLLLLSYQLGLWLQPSLGSADNCLSACQKVSDAEAIRLIGLGTWRLRGHMGPLFEGLAAQIEGAWRHKVPGLGLGPLPRVRRPSRMSRAAV